MEVSVVVPFGGMNIERLAALELVLDYYRAEFPDWAVTLASNHEHPFSRARACNEGVAKTAGPVVVINDADSLCPPDQLREAVRLAQAEPGLVWAYTLYQRLTREDTAIVHEYADALKAEDIEWKATHTVSTGCVAIRRDCYDQVGGMDEGFTDWGYEDMVFANRCKTYWTPRWVEGPLFHLWHGERREDDSPLSSEPENVARNWARFERSGGMGYR